MLKRFFLLAAIFSSSGLSAQTRVLDRIAEDKDFQFEWIAIAGSSPESKMSIQLCPRGTCDRFVASKPDLESFARFLDSYLVFASGYHWLSDIGTDIPLMPYIQERLPNVVASEVVLPDCGTQLTIESISCSLNALADSLEIEKYFVRGSYSRIEDGWRQRELTPGHVAVTLSRIAGYGVRLPQLGITSGAPRYWESRRDGVSDEFRQFMRERVVESGLPELIDVTEDVPRGQLLDVSDAYRIEPRRLQELPCWENRSCDYPTYEGTVQLNASTSESSGELIEFNLTVGGMPVALDVVERYGNRGVFNLEEVRITHGETYLPMDLWSDSVDSYPVASIFVDDIFVSDPWCASGWLSIRVEVALGPRRGRGVSTECIGARTAGAGF